MEKILELVPHPSVLPVVAPKFGYQKGSRMSSFRLELLSLILGRMVCNLWDDQHNQVLEIMSITCKFKIDSRE